MQIIQYSQPLLLLFHIKVGNIITIAVNVSNVTDLYGGSIDFVYDSKLIEVQSVTKGNIFASNEVLTPIGPNEKIENGQASFAISMKGNKPGINSTSGTIAIIKAKVLKEGTVKLNTTNTNTPTLTLNGNTIRVKLSNSNGNNIGYNFTNKDISLKSNASLNIQIDKPTSNLGEPITFTASSNLGNDAQYRFYIYIDNTWKLVQPYSDKNTFTYKAPKPGSYKVRVWVVDKNNVSNFTYKDLDFSVVNIASLNIQIDKPTSNLGEPITFTASSNLGDDAQYRFYIYIDNTWKLVQPYSDKNTFTYKAPKPGSYKVRVWVVDKNNVSNFTYKDLDFSVVNIASLNIQIDKPTSNLGEPITFTASSNLGDDAQYRFYIYIDNTWKLVQPYSDKNTFTYKAPKSGSYKVRVWVVDKNNVSNFTYKDLDFSVVNIASLNIQIDKPTSNLGEPITFTASSNLGDDAQYRFYIYIDNTWKLVQPYSDKNTFTYKAPKPGSYKVRVWVVDKNNVSNFTYKDLDFSVVNIASLNIQIDKPTSNLGESITFTASSNLGDDAQYRFYIYIDNTWKLVQPYSDKNTFTYKAPKPGSYKVRVWVVDKNNVSNFTYKDLDFSIK
ncbi:triple tyrosine motif-containing protein [Clostridium tertium]|uniref:triple tyrosine motif-containing protein n=2 Tax=Clostridium tertium TaxID=1559 RepID=UPI002E262F7A